MINKENIKGFIVGATAAALMCSTAAFAQSIEKTVSAVYNNIKLVINGSEVTPTDVNGNAAEPFIVDGTTYLPVRAVANALGEEVNWDPETYTVYIGDMPKEEEKTVVPDAPVMESFKSNVLANVDKTQITGAMYNYIINQTCKTGSLEAYADNYSSEGNLQTLTINGAPAASAFAQSASSQFSQIFALYAASENDKTYKKDDASIDEEWNNFKANFKTEEDYNTFLSENSTTDESMKSLINAGTAANLYAENLYNTENNREYTEAQLYKAYNENFVHAKHILVADEAKAKEIIQQLKKGKKFDDAVKEYGTDPGQPEDGYIFTKGEMVKEFEEAAFNLKENSYTAEPVKTNYGYHIIYRYPITQADVKADFDNIRKKVANNRYTALLNDIFQKYTISYTEKYEEYILTIR